MHIGLLGPFTTAGVAHHLPADHGLPEGMGGTPVTLLADELVSAGHDVTVWSLSPDLPEPVRADGPHLRVRYLPWRDGGRGRDQYRDERRWLRRALVGEGADVDVLHAHWTYEYALAALRTPAVRDVPLLVTSHDWAPTILRFQIDPYRAMRLVMATRVYARRPALTVPSPYLATLIRRGTGLSSTVVPNGLATSQLVSAPRSWSRPGRQVLCVADGFGDRKNTATLFRAIDRLRGAGTDVTLTVVGTDHGPDEPAAHWARANGVADGITFLGRVPYERVLELMSAADVLTHPAKEESFGMVLIEAMAQGLPVVGGRDSGAVAWVLGHGAAGVLVDVADAASVAEGTQAVLANPDRATALSAAGLDNVRDRFTMPVVAQGYLDAYNAVRGG